MVFAIALFIVAIGTPDAASAAGPVISVSTLNDTLANDGFCSLREAIISANTNLSSGGATGECPAGSASVVDTIQVPAGLYTLTINGTGENNSATGDLDILGGLDIEGASASSTVISGSGITDHIFDLRTGASSTISDVTITGGNPTSGSGGGINSNGKLLLEGSTIILNVTPGDGGGIFAGGGAVTTIIGSTISNNTASTGGGGIFILSGNTSIDNSTISGNTANGLGGGIQFDSSVDILIINNSTIAGNTASTTKNGGGLGIQNGQVKLRNTIIADNTAGGSGPDCFGTISGSEDHNLIENISGCTIFGSTSNNITGQDPKLGALTFNGGPTQTHALLSGSPAIDKGNPATPGSAAASCLPTDQRGINRPQGTNCDIGAFEVQGTGTPEADVSVVKTDTPDPVVAGTNLTYKITVTNNSTTTASSNVRTTDKLPPGTTLVSAIVEGGSCTGTTEITCNFGTLAAGDSRFATIVVKVDAGATGSISNTASTTADTLDTVISNNSFKAVTQVNPGSQVPSVTPWALVGLALVFLMTFSRKIKREVLARVSSLR
jgi:uncharacterized repeat protein (TIGR01451 family)/CSLREA domain-containing protein